MNLKLILFLLERRLKERYENKSFVKFRVIFKKLCILEVNLCAKLSMLKNALEYS